MLDRNMTLSLKITALLFILIGILAIYTTINDLKSGTLTLNVFIFCLVVGIGLLRNRNSSKRWGRLWTWVFFVFGIFFVGSVVCGIATIFDYTVKDGLPYYALGLVVTTPLMFIPLFMNRAINSSK
jgi:hypothetical protein